jgi:hypothetical protein
MISQHSLENTELYLNNKPSNLRGFLNFRPLNFQIIKLNFCHNIEFLRMREILAVIFSGKFDFLILNKSAT